MAPETVLPAAQYLRMSTEHQQYSITNQISVIRTYAERVGFEIVRTYSDAARSGVSFKNRPALKRLLEDVISGEGKFKAVLVYDVSRWGRFQDCDEAAHYEFVCKRASVPVHYCAEPFRNDCAISSAVLKAVKRAMAAEYSRELGERVFAAEQRWAELGFKQGGRAGYAFYRLMVSGDGKRKQLLSKGEVKCLQSDRVVLVPGNPEEVALVQEIFRLVAEEKKKPYQVASHLNASGAMHRGHPWTHQAVSRILSNKQYAGCYVWNRTTRRLGGPNIPLPSSSWVVCPRAFEPIVAPETYEHAQRVLNERTCAKTNDIVIKDLRNLLCRYGKLSETLLSQTPGAPSASTCRQRFGSLRLAFQAAGYPRTH